MASTDGAPSKSSGADDPVLAGALSEMVSEGATLDQPFPTDDQTPGASQPDASASAATAIPAKEPGDRGSEPAPADSAKLAPVDPAAPPDASAETPADPLAGTEPVTYGQGQKLDWAHRVAGEGLFVAEADVPRFQQLAEQRDTLERAARDMVARSSELDRLTTWDIQDADGKPHSLSGPAAIEARDVAIARLDASVTVMDAVLAALSDPLKFPDYVGVGQDGKPVLHPQALEYLVKDVKLAAQDAEHQARAHFKARGSPSTNGAAPSTSPSNTGINFAQAAPAVIAEAAGSHASVLTPEDKTFLAEQLPQYLRTVTEKDRMDNPLLKMGSPIVSERFTAVVQRTIALRTQAKTQAKAAETAGKHNAGMDRGRQPAKAAPKPAVPAKPPEPAGRKKADWDTPLTAALAEMGIER